MPVSGKAGSTCSLGKPKALSALQERLHARHQEAVGALQAAIAELNGRVDDSQKALLMALKGDLSSSHADIVRMIATEDSTAVTNEVFLDDYTLQCAEADPGAVLPPFVDAFHTPEDRNFSDSLSRVRAERLRMLQGLVSLRELYQQRVDRIAACAEALRAEEDDRKNALQEVLRNFMSTLATISYCSVESSQVLAQRVLHSVNEQVAANYAAVEALWGQLGRREVLKQEEYCAVMANLYGRTIHRMGRSLMLGLRTLLQSSYFRRPAARMRCVEEVNAVSVSAHRDGVHLLDTLGVLVSSLRVSAATAGPEEAQQPCGGTGDVGWLHLYHPETTSDPFPDGCTTVVDEWRMKANIVLRNSLACCTGVIAAMREKEAAHLAEAQGLFAELQASLVWLHTLSTEEQDYLLRASITPGAVSEVYAPFMSPEAEVVDAIVSQSRVMIDPLLEALQLEGRWFESTVAGGLLRSHTSFEDAILRSYFSVLRWFEKATEELVNTARAVLNHVRRFYTQRYEAWMNYQDDLQRMEAHFAELCGRLSNSASVDAAKEFFIEGLEYLEEISRRYTSFHCATIADITSIVAEVQENCCQVCGELQRKIGLESVAATETRLIAERQARVAAAIAQMAQEQQSHKKRSKRSEDSFSQPSLPAIDDNPTAEENFPQVVGPNGVTYNIIAPLTLIPEEQTHKPVLPPVIPVPQGKGKAGPRAPNRNRPRQKTPDVSAPQLSSPPEAKPTVEPAFVQNYQPLFADSILASENFIKQADVNIWKERLRVELLHWLNTLAATTQENIEAYCARTRKECERSNNELRRRHRRRPASFQADVYEARVRTLENNVSACLKYAARLKDRAAKVNEWWEAFRSDPASARADADTLEKLEKLRESTAMATSLSALQANERQHTALVRSYQESYAHSAHSVLEHLLQLKESLVAECQQFMAERAKSLEEGEVEEGVTLETAIAQDPLYTLVANILEQLNATTNVVEAEILQNVETRRTAMESTRATYLATYSQHTSEMQLQAKMHEVLSRLKARVQSFILTSRAAEESLAALITKLENHLAVSTSKPSFETNVKAILQNEDAVETPRVGPHTAIDALTVDTMSALTARLEGELLVARVNRQRRVRASKAAEIMAAVDSLREVLFSRGATLNALVCAVELIHLLPSHYIEPKPITNPTKEEPRMGSRGSSGGRKNRSRSASNAPPVLPLPTAVPIIAQFRTWVTAVKANALELVADHLETFPPPLLRKLPGSDGEGTMESVQAFIDATCQVQETRLTTHVREALKVYYEQVQRVHRAVEAIPQVLAISLYAVTTRTIESRLRCVLDEFFLFMRRSIDLKDVHRGRVKVVFSATGQQDVLKQLDADELMRQSTSAQVLLRLWGMGLREVQDEAGMHAARCYTATTALFQLLRGIVTPEHLKPCNWELPTGYHRGFKHLLKLKELRDRTGPNDTNSNRREKNKPVQETSVLRTDGGGRGGKDRNANTGDILAAPVFTETEYPGLPLSRLRPLDGFNADNPQHTVQPLPSAQSFFIVSDERVTDTPSSRRGLTTRLRHASYVESTQAEDGTAMSPPFSCPTSKMHQAAVALTRRAVDALNQEAEVAAKAVAAFFADCAEREQQWAQQWALTVGRLKAPPPPGIVEVGTTPSGSQPVAGVMSL